MYHDRHNNYHSGYCLLYKQLYERSNRQVQIVDPVMEGFWWHKLLDGLQRQSGRHNQRQGFIWGSAILFCQIVLGFLISSKERRLILKQSFGGKMLSWQFTFIRQQALKTCGVVFFKISSINPKRCKVYARQWHW